VKPKLVTGLVLTALLVAAVGVVVLVPGGLFPAGTRADEGDGPPDQVVVAGLVRDFRASHSDFGDTPPEGPGHVAGNVGLLLPTAEQPAFTAAGFKVAQQWRDREGRPIAPHLAHMSGSPGGTGTLGLRVKDRIEVKHNATIDAFNSDLGPYGLNGNYGADAYVSTNATAARRVKIDHKGVVHGRVMVGPGGDPAQVIEARGTITGAAGVLTEAFAIPTLDLPDDLGPLTEHLDIHDQSITFTGDVNEDDDVDVPAMHFGKLHLKHGAVLTVVGDLRIVCDHELKIHKAEVILAPDATLTIYAAPGAEVEIKEQSLVNTEGADPGLLMINALGGGKLEIGHRSHVYAIVTAPERELEIKAAGHLYGAFLGDSVKLEHDWCGLHTDLGSALPGPFNFVLTLREKLEMNDQARLDGFDSNQGPYGGANANLDALVMVNVYAGSKKKGHVKLEHESTLVGDVLIGPGGSPQQAVHVHSGCEITGTVATMAAPRAIPVVTPPHMGASAGELHRHGGTYRISTDVRYKKIKIEKNAKLEIEGDRVIRCDQTFELKENSDVILLPGARLTLYLGKDLKVEKNSKFNVNTGNPQLVSIRRSGLGKKGKVKVKDNSKLVAWVQGERTDLDVDDRSHFYGSFAGRKAKVRKSSELHVDMAGLSFCVEIDDTEGSSGGPALGGITSAASFDEWYRDVLGVNQMKVHSITLTRGIDGVYSYLDDDFHPIDDQLFGNEGLPHNQNFTYMIAAHFQYEDCGGQFVEFEGGDGAWLFINHQLVLDIGGVSSDSSQYVDLDRLGLQPGTSNTFNLYWSNRRLSGSVFRLRTNVILDSSGHVPVIMQYD
jgi:fibro-slime domain-containing protein